jgi:hypothetical protein
LLLGDAWAAKKGSVFIARARHGGPETGQHCEYIAVTRRHRKGYLAAYKTHSGPVLWFLFQTGTTGETISLQRGLLFEALLLSAFEHPHIVKVGAPFLL